MNKLNNGIRRQNTRKIIQSGGVHRNHPYVHKGHTIYYNSRPNVDGDPETIYINGGRSKGKYPCFTLIIKAESATLQGVQSGGNCFADGYDNTKEMVIAAFSLAKSKGCTVFELTDNSTKTCHSHKFKLADMYFMTTGRTWYESILSVKIKDYSESVMDGFREKVRSSTWSDVSAYLISQGKTANFDFEDLDKNKVGSCMEALNIIAKMRNEVSCKFFADCLQTIFDAHDMKSFHGTSWTVEISADSTRQSGSSKKKKKRNNTTV